MSSRTLGSFLVLLLPAFLAAPAAAAPVRVAGWVFLPDGLAADAAKVDLLPAGLTRGEVTARLVGPPTATAVVGTGGRFELAAEPGRYRLRVSRDGFLPVDLEVPLLVEETDLVPIVLRTARPLALRLAGPDGRPAAGVTVFAAGEPSPSRAPWNAQAVSDAAGRLTLPVAPEGLATLQVSGPALADRLAARPRAQGELAFRLPRREPVVFEVRGADGKPLPDALVWLGDAIPPGRTDGIGRFAAALPPGEETAVVAWGPAGERSQPTAPTAAVRRGNAAIVLRLAPPALVSGRVADPAGKPVAGALVFTSTGPSTLSGPEDEFRLSVPAGETGPVQAVAPGLLWAEAPFAPGQAVRLSLRPAAALAGRALDGTGRPVPGARVTALCKAPGAGDGGSDPRPFETSTRPDGSFRLGGIEPGARCTVAAGRRALVSAPERATAPAAGLRLTLTAGLTVSGRVAGPRNEPVELAEITLAPEGPAGTSGPVSSLSGVDGRFEIAPFAPGAYRLALRHPGFVAVERRAVQIAMPAAGGTGVDLGTLRLEPGLALQGVVVDAKGAPVEGARLTATHRSHESREPARQVATSGADGRFEVTGLLPGATFFLQAEKQGYAPAAQTVATPSPGSLRLELGALRFLSGRVLGPRGEPIPGATLNAVAERQIRHGMGSSGTGSSRQLGQSDAEGRFRVQVAEPGRLDLEVIARGWRPRLVESLELPEEGELEGIEVRLERGASLTGRVFDGEAPLAGVRVHAFLRRESASLKSGRHSVGADTDAAGRYRLEGLETGPYTVSVFTQGGGQMQRETTVSAEGAVLDFHLPSAEISGRLLDEEGRPLSRGEVSLSRLGEGGSSSIEMRPGGVFRFARVSDGSYQLNAWAPGFAPLEKPVAAEVAGGSVTGLEIRLRRATGRLTGRILGVSTEEAAAAQVEALPAGRPGPEAEGVGRVGGEVPGTYRLEGLSPGPWRVTAKLPPDRVASGHAIFEPGMSEAVLDLTFPPTFELRGRVTLDGIPRPGAAVEVNGPQTKQTTSGEDGRFLLEGLPQGSYLLLATLGKDNTIVRRLELSGNLELALDLETGTLSGRISDPATGEPLAGCRIALRNEDGTTSVTGPTVLSGERGDYAVPGLATGRYRATIECPGRPPQEKPVVVAAPETVLDVAIGG